MLEAGGVQGHRPRQPCGSHSTGSAAPDGCVQAALGVDGSSGTVRAEAPLDGAQDASRFFLGIPPGTPLGETKGTTEKLKRVLRNCHQRFFEERASMKLGSALNRSKHDPLK